LPHPSKPHAVPKVQFEIYDFGFEMQDSSDFEIPDFQIPSRPRATRIARPTAIPNVQFKIYDFGFEMQDLSDFEIPDFRIPDSRSPIPLPVPALHE
jgi:hypothetical protein